MGKLAGLLLVLGLGACGGAQPVHHAAVGGWTGYEPLHGKAAIRVQRCFQHPRMFARKLESCIAAAKAPRATSVRPPTVIRKDVTPFTAAGYLRHGLRVTHVVRRGGPLCMPTSDVLPNDVYRCSAGRYIYDPCWRDWRAPRPEVVCLFEPWARTATRLLLPKAPLRPYGHDDFSVEPWGITLASGAKCVAFQGAHDAAEVKGRMVTVDYYCGKKSPVALLRGIRRGATWMIRAVRYHARRPGTTYLGWVRVKTAWYGGNDPLSHRP